MIITRGYAKKLINRKDAREVCLVINGDGKEYVCVERTDTYETVHYAAKTADSKRLRLADKVSDYQQPYK